MSGAQLAEWFKRPELAALKSSVGGGKSGAYAGWAWIATIVLAFLNFDNIAEGRLLPSLIGLAFLWLPAKLADKLSGRGE